jgi:hypothetical protein
MTEGDAWIMTKGFKDSNAWQRRHHPMPVASDRYFTEVPKLTAVLGTAEAEKLATEGQGGR